MEVKGLVLFLLGICLLIPPPIRCIDHDDMRPSQIMRILNQLREHFKLGNDANFDDVIQYAYSKLSANSKSRRTQSNSRRKPMWMKK